MSDFDQHFLDEQVRNVPLPKGLLERLRATGEGKLDDRQLDALVRDVPVPANLTDCLKTIPADAAVDGLLRNVEVPETLAGKLRGIATDDTVTDDTGLPDLAPVGSVPNIETELSATGLSWPVLSRYVVAASVLVTIGLVGFWSLGDRGKPVPLADSSRAEPSIEPSVEPDVDAVVAVAEPAPDDVADSNVPPATNSLLVESFSSTLTDLLPTEAGPTELGPADALAESQQRVADEPDVQYEPLDPLQNGDRKIIAYGNIDQVAELQPVPRIVARGVMPPLVKEFDRLRLIKDGVHPFVTLRKSTVLESVQVPLATETTSFDMLRRYLSRHRLPPAEEIRPEDFLSAMDYDFPRPARTALGIVTAAGPSVFGTAGRQLLQVAVQATDHITNRTGPTQLIVAVDVSIGLGRRERLDSLRKGLASWFSRLGPDDRVTLLVMHEEPEILIDCAGPEDGERLRAALNRLVPYPSCDLTAGLAAVANLAGRTDLVLSRQRVVLFIRGLGDMSESNVESLEKLVRDATDDRTGWDAVDLRNADLHNADFGDIHTEQDARQLERLVLAGRGKVWRAHDPREVAHAISEAQLGRSTLVAKEARLTVRFHPGAVKSYRLIGHEAHAAGGLVAGPLEASFQLGDASTALFELELKPTGSEEVAQVTLVWKDPTKTGRSVRQQWSVSRLQFVTTLERAPRSLQMAAIAGATAEILRASPYISSESGTLAGVLKVADGLDPSLADNDSLREFLGMVELARQSGRARP